MAATLLKKASFVTQSDYFFQGYKRGKRSARGVSFSSNMTDITQKRYTLSLNAIIPALIIALASR
ncbi:hypothetical protein PANT111_70005 [Pantoea brenneri]|uniref:Uncharacterized protein n=1 Tax=Pantoea brenneri TaxID=472694 RepID=A0AAX3JCL4_9GAMM|nr:hypothetical protein PANT111_70005 [Pantoea brenneri]